MWPIPFSELIDVLAPAAAPLAPRSPRSREPIERAIAWTTSEFRVGDAFFAVEKVLDRFVPTALASGATCIVRKGTVGESDLRSDVRDRIFVSDNPLRAFRQLAAHLRQSFAFPVVAVGGSNGKTTTKEMITAILRAGGRRVTSTPGTNNGWVGVPITLCHPAHRAPAPDALVIEIGIDDVGSMAHHVALAAPDVAVLTALGVEHLAGLKTHANVVAEELALFAGSKRRIWLAAEPALRARLDEARAGDVVVHETEDGVRPRDGVLELVYGWRAASPTAGILMLRWGGRTLEATLPLPGAHNGRNAALATAAAVVLGRSLDDAAAALATFRGPEQRCRIAELASGCTLIDDSYNASPASVEAALDVLAAFDSCRPRVVVLGDMLDLGDETEALHRSLLPKIAALRGAHVRLYGEEATKLKRDLPLAASVGCAGPAEDPGDLIDLAALDDAVVLVKGSRGMALERVVERLVAVADAGWDPTAVGVGIVGPDARAFASAAGAVVQAQRASNGPRVFVRALTLAELEEGAAARRAYDVAVITGVALREGADVERELAAIAQLVVHLRPGGVLVLSAPVPTAPNRDPPDDSEEDRVDVGEAMALLAGVLPPHATARSVPFAETFSVVISELSARGCTEAPKFATGTTPKVL